MNTVNRNITINVTADQYIGFTKLAGLSGASKNEYGKALVAYAIAHQLLAGEKLDDKHLWLEAITGGTRPLPKIGIEIKAGPPAKLPPLHISKKSGLYQVEAGPIALRAAEQPPAPRKRTA